jgi:hypothetical protein
MTFMHTMLGASSVPKLFIVFLFNNPGIGIHFLKDVRLIPSSTVFSQEHVVAHWLRH